MPLAKNKLFVHLILPLLYIFCIFAQQPAPAQDFSIEHILSAPYLTNLVAAPDSDRIAWVENIEGQRNIWMAAAPNFEAIKLTNYSKDDGMPISQLAFSYDSAFLIYVHGGSANRGGEHPNPTSAPSGADQGIWAVRTQSGSLPWRLAHGSHPVLSPTSNELLFTDRGQIFFGADYFARHRKPLQQQSAPIHQRPWQQWLPTVVSGGKLGRICQFTRRS